MHAVALLALGLLLSACAYQLTTDLSADGNGQFIGERYFHANDRAALQDDGTTPQAFCEDFQARGRLPAQQLTYEEHEDAFRCKVTLSFGSLDELRGIHAQLDGVTVNELALTGDKLTYDVSILMASSPGSAQVGAAEQLNWVLRPPGTVSTHNADDDQNDQLTWNIAYDTPVTAHAESTISLTDRIGGLVPWLVGLACVVGLIIVAVAALTIMRCRPARP